MDAVTIARAVTQACLRPEHGKLYGDKDKLILAIAEAIRQVRAEARQEGAEAMRTACQAVVRQTLGKDHADAYRLCRDAISALDPNASLRFALDDRA